MNHMRATMRERRRPDRARRARYSVESCEPAAASLIGM